MDQNASSNKPKDKPVHEVRLGSIKAAIWRNESASGTRHNVTFSRIYKDREEDAWKSTDSFGRDDLLMLAKVADHAHTWILEHRTDRESTAAE